ncbi:lanthionine synthetase C family protein [Piscinibacter terrae]|uniref:Lanthionine synthetase n=1 Tax=Piscinibacter terrae TaxID=2496871 RepID=A0A3N7HLP4_9BURK|nr:LanC-like protein [Albitalea terrae]RQP23014.1 lanthionine synthetase [Albitalea terrae]
MMLFDPARHEALTHHAWDAGRAAEAIQAIVRDTEQHRISQGRWPVHPLDDEGDTPATGFKGMYLGSAGVLWALWYLQREGAADLLSDPADAMQQAWADYQADPDGGTAVPSYYLGEVGILLVLWCMHESREVADLIHASVASNIRNPTNEALWAAPGTMGAAWHLWQMTQEERWRNLFLRNVDYLWETWHFDEQAQCHLWTQDLYGKTVQYLGAGHGFAGNVYPLLKGASLLDESQREALYDRCVTTLRAMARREDDAVNWPPGTYTPRPGSPSMLMQWCHGAPGIVTALADFPVHRSSEMDAMLTAAGHAIWQAGPLTKGPGLCHGTAGNGYAFLKLHRRTGDPLWLERARAFAVHAIGQCERMRQQHGQGRYSLWTGDPGLAVYLWHCLQEAAELPALDVLR